MEIIKYQKSKHQQIWDDYVETSNNGTIFHLRKFLAYHQNREFQDHSLMFYENNKIVAVFAAAIIDNCLYSHPGASFGGLVYNQLSFKDCKEIIALIIEYAKENKTSKITVIPPPFIYYQQYNETMEYCLYNHGFEIAEYYISSFVNLNSEPMELIHNRKKRYIKKLKNEIEIKASEDLDAFYPILIDNKARHNVKPTHSKKELKILMQQFPEQIKLLLSYKNNEVIGGSLVFITNQDSCILFYNMINYEYQELQVASLQIYETLKWAYKNKIKFLDIGVSQLYKNDKIIPHDSLINFKEQFGSQAMIRKVMKLKL